MTNSLLARFAATVVKAGIAPVIRVLGGLALATALAACSAQETEQQLLDRAQLAMAQGNDRAAVIDVKTALQQNPDSAPARSLLGELYIYQQNPVAAVAEFERSLAAVADDRVRVLYARALLSADNSERLLALDQQGEFASVAENPHYLTALARAHAAEGDLLKATDAMVTALAAAPEDPYVTTANAFFELMYSGGMDEAQESLQETLDLHPDYADAWSLLGSIQYMKSEFDVAEASFARAAELNPYRLADRLNLVNVRIELEKTEAARSELNRLLASTTNHPGVHFLEGKMLMDEGDNEGALAAFFKVLNVQPRHKESLYLATIANIREGNYATALGQINSFLSMEPDHLNGRLLLSHLHLLMANPEAAEALARDVLEEDYMNYPAMGLLATALNTPSAQGPGDSMTEARETEESIDLYQRMTAARPDAMEPRLALGSALLQTGDGAGGIEQFQLAHDLDPTSTVAQERLIQAQLSAGDIAAAKAEAEDYAAQYPDNPRPSLLLARIALQENNTSGARTHFERALVLDPGNVMANNGLAVLASADKDLEQARARYMNALEHHPDDITSLLNLASIEAALGNSGAMEDNLEKAMQVDPAALAPRLFLARAMLAESRGEEALRLLAQVQEDYPRTPGLWLLLTEALLATGDLASATEAGAHLLGLIPDDAIALGTMARVELRTGQFGEAEKHLNQALAGQPDNEDFNKLLIDALMAQGKLEETNAVMERLPEAMTNEPAVLVARGRIALAGDKPAEAEPYLRSAQAEDPSAMTLLWLSGAIVAQGREDEAIKLLNDWLVDNPADVVVRNQLASTYLQSGYDQQAREHYQLVLESVPDNVLVLNNLAWLLRENDPQQALAHIEKANRLAPGNPLIMDTYAMIQLERNAIPEALDLNQQALDVMPDNQQFLYHRAQILHADGQGEQAIPILESLVGLAEGAGESAEKEQARMLLAEIQGPQ